MKPVVTWAQATRVNPYRTGPSFPGGLGVQSPFIRKTEKRRFCTWRNFCIVFN